MHAGMYQEVLLQVTFHCRAGSCHEHCDLETTKGIRKVIEGISETIHGDCDQINSNLKLLGALQNPPRMKGILQELKGTLKLIEVLSNPGPAPRLQGCRVIDFRI